ncbi:MAG: hypothetical protein WC341_03960 [Bacteroidales bacterium]|jgi:opacity protein-like surface antigen
MDQLIKEKFDSFEPVPPPHVWLGVLSGLDAHQKTTAYNKKRTIAILTAAFLLVLLTLYFLLPGISGIDNAPIREENKVVEIIENTAEQNVVATNPNVADMQKANIQEHSEVISHETIQPEVSETIEIVENSSAQKGETNQTRSSTKRVIPANEQSDAISSEGHTYGNQYEMSGLKFRKLFCINRPATDSAMLLLQQNNTIERFGEKAIDSQKTKKQTKPHRWSNFIGVSPEFVLTAFDSVTVLNSYTLNYEPVYFINKHLFVRFGIGVTTTRDRGFARLDYISNDLMGTYNDVYNVTFDSIDGQVVPTYFTKTVEVWDSIRHLSVSEVTNRYIYIQLPLLFGYYHHSKNSGLNWYFYGGPALNVQLAKTIDTPHPAEKDIEIIHFQNKLPERSTTYYQLWLGAGVEYKVSDQISVAIEPGYRYYLTSIFNKQGYNKPISALTLRVGTIIRLN